MPWLIALRVVSLPAPDSRMKNEAISAEVNRSPSTSACTRLVVRSSRGRDRRDSANCAPYAARSRTALMIVSWSPPTSLSPAPSNTVVQWKTSGSSSSGMPIMSQMICSGSGPDSDWTKSACPSGWLDTIVVDQPLRTNPDAVLDAGHHFRRECPVDDRTQPEVPRIVEVDHRAAELGDRGIYLGKRHAGRDRTEDLRMPAREVDVIERRERPVPGSRLESLEHRSLEEHDGRFATKRGEGTVPQIVVP